MNENYAMPQMPGDVKDGIVKGMYKFQSSKKKNVKLHAQLFGSGTIFNEVLKAAEILEEDYKVATDIWSVTSYKELRREALDVERHNLLNPGSKPKESYLQKSLKNEKGVFIASSDYVKALPDSVSKWFPRKLYSLGTDGFGRSEGRKELRDFFEVDAKHIVLATLYALANEGSIKMTAVEKAVKDLQINPAKPNPMNS
jgi:pyruvate dehydrogenase E1 component